MYNAPQRAKRLYFDVIPRAVDEYLANAAKLADQPDPMSNPAWFIQPDPSVRDSALVPFAMLLNLASVVNAETPDLLWGFIRRYAPGASPERMPFLDRLVRHAIAYYQDRVRPTKQYRAPDARERVALADLAATLGDLPAETPADEIQNAVFAVGKRHDFPELRAWFGCLYQVLLGQAEGPRFGGFVALYGIGETVALIEQALARTVDAA